MTQRTHIVSSGFATESSYAPASPQTKFSRRPRERVLRAPQAERIGTAQPELPPHPVDQIPPVAFGDQLGGLPKTTKVGGRVFTWVM